MGDRCLRVDGAARPAALHFCLPACEPIAKVFNPEPMDRVRAAFSQSCARPFTRRELTLAQRGAGVAALDVDVVHTL
jgi:hypothetical protein